MIRCDVGLWVDAFMSLGLEWGRTKASGSRR